MVFALKGLSRQPGSPSKPSTSWSMKLLFFLGLLFLIIRARYGFCFNDEPFCVTLAQRLYNGDALIADEWHGCQFFSAVMLPLYAFFRFFFDSNDGILLFLRHTYCIFWWLCSIHVAKSIAKSNVSTALVFLFLLFFSPLDYMTISYTSVGLMSALVISCILYKIPTDAACRNHFAAIVFSVFFALLVLCSPFMIVAYLVLFIAAVIGATYTKKSSIRTYFSNLLDIFRFALIADCILALLYIVFFILMRADLSAILNSIPHILADPEHPSNGFLQPIMEMINQVYSLNPVFLITSFLTFAFALFNRPYRFRGLLFCINSILYACSQIIAIVTPNLFNVQMLPIAFLGIAAFALLENRNFKLFFSLYGFSILYALLNGLASNTGIMAVSMCATIAGCAAMVFIVQLCRELFDQYEKKNMLRLISAVMICGILCMQISSEVYIKFSRQYWDSPPYQLTQTISCGAAKGLKTTPPTAKQYMDNYHALTALLSQTDTSGKRFLSCTSAPYLYLDADMDFGTFSAWSFGYGSRLNDRILDYQQVRPENTADIIYCASKEDILPLIDASYEQYEYLGHYLFVKD